MKKILPILTFSIISLTGFSTVHTVKNDGTTFDPDVLTITAGDTVKFSLEIAHNAVEVSQSTWDANGTTALGGGFATPKGGGTVLPANLTVGTHYYVCQPHASMGMKAKIIVNAANGIAVNQAVLPISLFPIPATDFISVKGGISKNVAYSIFAMDGKEVLSGKLNPTQTEIFIQALAPGMYFFMAEGTEKKAFTVIEH
ncbi:MAG TPA: plastocyanin/azurin family copper-binding protein [Bacteroidia bacterium]|jgi:plastocyanin|nr:plastocyanin/azurin family copper-binding protein [Bacteroidia bacterium]